MQATQTELGSAQTRWASRADKTLCPLHPFARKRFIARDVAPRTALRTRVFWGRKRLAVGLQLERVSINAGGSDPILRIGKCSPRIIARQPHLT